jgi:hypothetical protein
MMFFGNNANNSPSIHGGRQPAGDGGMLFLLCILVTAEQNTVDETKVLEKELLIEPLTVATSLRFGLSGGWGHNTLSTVWSSY